MLSDWIGALTGSEPSDQRAMLRPALTTTVREI